MSDNKGSCGLLTFDIFNGTRITVQEFFCGFIVDPEFFLWNLTLKILENYHGWAIIGTWMHMDMNF